MMSSPLYPIAIIGAGASGLMAAIAASGMRPHSVCLLEKEARVGRKLLATGNGRCNLLNMDVSAERYHGSGSGAALSLLRRMPPECLLAEFARMGLRCREEKEGRVYPFSGHAGSVLDTLRAACARGGVTIQTDTEVTRIERAAEGFLLHTAAGGRLTANRVIIAAGGRASPSFGADGGAYTLLSSMGHTIAEAFPTLAPLKLPPERIRGLKGVRTQATLTLFVGEPIARVERGEALFTEYGLSGVAAMQLSRLAFEALRERRQPSLRITLMETDAAEAEVRLRRELFSGEPMESFFTGLLHARIGACLLREAGVSPQEPVTEQTASRVLPLLSDWRLPVLGILPFQHAQCTAGGAVLSQFNPETLESLRVPGLHACGEAMDVDGDCGGYNLMWAFASGIAAGKSAASSIITTFEEAP